MSRWVWPLVIVLATLAAFAVDRTFWPDRTIVALYAIPIIIASLRCPLWALFVAILGINLAALDDIFQTGHLAPSDEISIVALLTISGLAVLYAVSRQDAERKIHRQQLVIKTVSELRQPLAVILGYCQLLQNHLETEQLRTKALDATQRAALHLRDMLDDIMVKWGED